MPVFRIEVAARGTDAVSQNIISELAAVGLGGVRRASASRLYLIEGRLSRDDAVRIGRELLADPITESATVSGEGEPVPPPSSGLAVEVHPRPGVMDPVAESALAELRSEAYDVTAVRTGRRFVVDGELNGDSLLAAVQSALANDCIELVVFGTTGAAPAPSAPTYPFRLRHVALGGMDDAELERLARDAHLFLSPNEMRAVRRHFAESRRDPTDLELETIAQTWSEHCVHKTLKSAVVYRGEPMPGGANPGRRPVTSAVSAERNADVELRYDNLLKDTVVRATETVIRERRGPECLSVFKDNAGVIGFDDTLGIAFKVETHNHPSAIEPYGGAATGVGGCIRDVMGCGLGARPIANTDVFCVAPPDWPLHRLPAGVMHPRRVLRGVVRGVADYGNRMGIPTVNGAIHFDPRYLGNPLVFCGCVGLIPRDRVSKRAAAGDRIVLVGGRTGRDGIHGATFSSAELTDSHADEFSHAVQIGNAITEKRVLDALLQARDAAGGCLYSAITDCGAGGLSSAVGEMAEEVGAIVDLERVPLKYPGLRYDEIWISEAQERMVVAVPPATLEPFLALMRAEEVEASVIGTFGPERGETRDNAAPRLLVRYLGTIVGDLDLAFLHHGLPRRERSAQWHVPTRSAERAPTVTPRNGADLLRRLSARLAHPTIASKEWVFRQYDHEVQGGSVIKPACGAGGGPGDAAVLRPKLDSARAIALGCGLAPQLGDADPYWMAAAAIDEAVRNVVCVGGAFEQTAILDNFCWGRTDDPRQLGALVRACQACHDLAVAYGTPFISGKDSLNNEFALGARDVDLLVETLGEFRPPDADPAGWQATLDGVRRTGRLAIPGTLLISALSIVQDAQHVASSDLKAAGDALWLIGAQPVLAFDVARAAATHQAVSRLIAGGTLRACHDCAEGGWLVALAEMAIGGDRGADVRTSAIPSSSAARPPDPFEEVVSGYVVAAAANIDVSAAVGAGVPAWRLGEVRDDDHFTLDGASRWVRELRADWTRWVTTVSGAQAIP